MDHFVDDNYKGLKRGCFALSIYVSKVSTHIGNQSAIGA